MAMQRTHNNSSSSISKGFGASEYARSEEELYKKAIALLEKCKIEARH